MSRHPHLLPPPLTLFYPLTAHRTTFVPAARVYRALRHQLKCVPTGERGTLGEYWITPKGVRFPVKDPMPTRDRTQVVAVTGRRVLSFPYDYAYALLAHASWLAAHAVPEEMLQPPSAAARRIVDLVVGPETLGPRLPPEVQGEGEDLIFV